MASFEDLKGKVLAKIEGLEKGSEKVIIHTQDGDAYMMYHVQDCCEVVQIEDVCGDVDDLLNSPILIAEENTSDSNPEGVKVEYQDSFTWTFYKLATRKGYVDIRWYGESNGYYSEAVEFELIEK